MSERNALQSNFYLSLGGQPVDLELMRDLEQVVVETSLHLPDVATITLHDPRLRWVDSALIEPGASLRVAARVGGVEARLFDGEIVELEPDFAGAAPRLVVRAFDRLHRLARLSFARAFQNVSDAELIGRLADEAGLHVRVGPAAAHIHRHLFQVNESNLALLQRRAAALGYLLFVDGDTLCCLPPEDEGGSIVLRLGETLAEFRPRLSTVGQVHSVLVRGWDVAAKRPVLGRASAAAGAPDIGRGHSAGGRSGGETTATAFNLRPELGVGDRPVGSQAAADALAKALAERRGAQFIEAEARCAGSPALIAGVDVVVEGVGQRFAGRYFVTAATHAGDARGTYETTFTVSGMRPATILGLLAPEPAGSPAAGLVVAVVTDNNDPEDMGRVRVAFPWLSPDHASGWARVAATGAGDRRGVFFLPEVGDEVLVGFEMGDVQQPFVLAGLWNGVDRPPLDSAAAVGGDVRRRVIRSRDGHEVSFDEGPDGGVTVRDRRGNLVRLGGSDGAVSVEAVGELRLKAGAGVTIEAGGKISLGGAGVEIDGGTAPVDVHGLVINLN
jgi:phage protein D/phage baseplate assembly protein gpV